MSLIGRIVWDFSQSRFYVRGSKSASPVPRHHKGTQRLVVIGSFPYPFSRIFARSSRVALGCLLSIVATLASVPESGADIYKFVDERGIAHYTNQPQGPEYRLILRSQKAWQPKGNANLEANRKRFSSLIAQIAKRYRVESALVHAIITAESAYDPDAVSRAGAVGLMQLMPATARRYGVADRRDPLENVLGGVRYLKELIARFNDVPLALAAYNAGEAAVIKYGNDIPPYPETQNYVRTVLGYYRRYRGSS